MFNCLCYVEIWEAIALVFEILRETEHKSDIVFSPFRSIKRFFCVRFNILNFHNLRFFYEKIIKFVK